VSAYWISLWNPVRFAKIAGKKAKNAKNCAKTAKKCSKNDRNCPKMHEK
jgi:hypothetical protein